MIPLIQQTENKRSSFNNEIHVGRKEATLGYPIKQAQPGSPLFAKVIKYFPHAFSLLEA